MGKKKMGLPSLFKNKEITTKPPWQWPSSCNHPKTLSFRTAAAGDDIFKTVNSVFFDPAAADVETPESWFTNSSASASFSTDSDGGVDSEFLETVIRGVRSERLFFEPGDTSSILEEVKSESESESKRVPFKESVMLAMESEDPYGDFRKSMEEMVETHGLQRDWECLEEMLGWYLRVNGKKNHGFIVGAFVDLVASIGGNSGSSGSADYFSAVSSLSSCSFTSSSASPLRSLGGAVEIDEEENMGRS